MSEPKRPIQSKCIDFRHFKGFIGNEAKQIGLQNCALQAEGPWFESMCSHNEKAHKYYNLWAFSFSEILESGFQVRHFTFSSFFLLFSL